MYGYIYLIRREGLELRWEVRREGFLTYDFYYTRCKFLRREEPKTCIGWDFYVFCRSIFYIVWHFFTSCGIFLHRVGGIFLHRVVFFYIWCKQQLHQVFHSAVDNIDERQQSTTTINDNNDDQTDDYDH